MSPPVFIVRVMARRSRSAIHVGIATSCTWTQHQLNQDQRKKIPPAQNGHVEACNKPDPQLRARICSRDFFHATQRPPASAIAKAPDGRRSPMCSTEVSVDDKFTRVTFFHTTQVVCIPSSRPSAAVDNAALHRSRHGKNTTSVQMSSSIHRVVRDQPQDPA